MRLPYRIVALFGTFAIAASLGGCNDAQAPIELPPVKPAPSAPLKIAVDPAPKDMKPAEGKTTEGKVVEELPPLVPPAGSKDERPDAKPK